MGCNVTLFGHITWVAGVRIAPTRNHYTVAKRFQVGPLQGCVCAVSKEPGTRALSNPLQPPKQGGVPCRG
ncbi:hypothetical protein COCOBI_01-6000 [Coccomyxa sp. Obi]|nr:hypothetical protein COCOBI_01-6000 [Coccomyxa sp. Obi]